MLILTNTGKAEIPGVNPIKFDGNAEKCKYNNSEDTKVLGSVGTFVKDAAIIVVAIVIVIMLLRNASIGRTVRFKKQFPLSKSCLSIL